MSACHLGQRIPGLHQVSRKEEPPSGRAQGPDRRRAPQGVGLVSGCECLGSAAPASRLGLQTPKIYAQNLWCLSVSGLALGPRRAGQSCFK